MMLLIADLSIPARHRTQLMAVGIGYTEVIGTVKGAKRYLILAH
jgi:hypothetical protein